MKIKITKKSLANFFTLILFGLTWFAIGWLLKGRQVQSDAKLVEQVQQILLSDYVDDSLTERQLSHSAIDGMIETLGDPYTTYFVPPFSMRYLDDFAGQSGVIGMLPEKVADDLVVSLIFPGESADLAGLKVGDVILSVDGVAFDAKTSANEAILIIRGPVDEPAHFVISRDGEIQEMDILRYARPIVSAEMLPEGIAYIAQYTFTTNSTEQMQVALHNMLAQNPKGIIWDLSRNGGGSMEAAQHILSFFIEDGNLFIAELKDGKQQEFLALGEALASDIPLVVLVGEHSYSAAETAAAAIMEHNRGMVIGSTTYGKGTIQATVPLAEDSLLQLTIGKWLSPSGVWYDVEGVNPQIYYEDNIETEENELLQYAVDYLLEIDNP